MKNATLRDSRRAVSARVRKPRPLGVSLARYSSMAAICGALLAGATASAADVYLDNNGSTAGSGITAGSTILWNSTAAIWNDVAGLGTPAFWMGNDTAIFAAAEARTPFTVTVDGPQSIGGLKFLLGGVTLVAGPTVGSGLVMTGNANFDVNADLVATVNTVISGTSDLTKLGFGTLVLGGTNTYIGRTLVGAGTLSISSDSNLGTAPGAVVPDSISFTGNSTMQFTGAGAQTLNANRGITIGNTFTGTMQVVSAATSLSYGGVIAGNSGSTFRKAGAGTLELTAANTLAGTLNIDGGTVKLSGNGALASTNGVTIGNRAIFTLDNSGTNVADRTAGALTSNGGTINFIGNAAATTETLGDLTLNAGALTINSTPGAGGSVLTIPTLTRAVVGGTLYLNGTGLGSATNQVVLTTAPALVNSILKYAVVNNGTVARFATHGGNGTSLAPLTTGYQDLETGWTGATINALPTADATLTVNRTAYSLTLDNGIDLLAPTADRSLTLNGAVLQTGGSSVIAGNTTSGLDNILAWGANEAIFHILGTLQLDRGNTTTLTGTGGFTKSGPGTLILNSVSSLTAATGAFNVNEGVLELRGASSLMTAAATLNLNGANLRLTQVAGTTAGVAYVGNPVVNADTTITISRVDNPGTVTTHTIGALSIGSGRTLSVNSLNLTAGTAYGLTAGATTITTGGATIDVANNGAGLATMTLGNVTNAGNTLTKTGAGDLVTIGSVGGFGGGTVDVQAGRIGYSFNTATPVITDSSTIVGTGGLIKSGASVVNLTGSTLLTGPITITGGTLGFSVLNSGDVITLGGTLSFVGNANHTVSRLINLSASSTLNAAGSGGAAVTYTGAITAAGNQVTLTGNGAGFLGTIAGGITQTAASGADLNVNSGTWTLSGVPTSIADDVIVTGSTAVLNLNSTGVLGYAASTSNGLYARTGGIINLGANNVTGVAAAGGNDFIFLGDNSVGVGTLNTNTFSITTPRLDLGQTTTGFEGAVLGTGTISAADYNLYRGTIEANMAGAGNLDKSSSGVVILKGDNSAWTGANNVLVGGLILDYTANNATKLNSAVSLDTRGVTVTFLGSATAPTVQNFASFTLSGTGTGLTPGANIIEVNNGTGQSITVNLGPITRNVSTGTVRFKLPLNGAITTTTANSSAGILGGYATVTDTTGTYFARNDGAGNIVSQLGTVKDDVTSWTMGDHVSDLGGYTGTLTGGLGVNSLRFNASGPSTVTLGTSGYLNIASGGILMTTASAGTGTITGGTLTSTAGEFVFTQDSPAQNLAIASAIGGSNAVTKTGLGSVTLSGLNSYSGATQLMAGTLVATGTGIGDNSTVNLSDDQPTTFQITGNETVGTIAGGNTSTGMLFGTVAIGSNTLTLRGGATYNGVFTGDGTIVRNTALNSTNMNLVGSTTTGFTGSMVINGGLVILSGSTGRLNAATSFTINKGGSFLIDNNDDSSPSDRLSDSASFTFNSADGNFAGATVVRGLAIRTDNTGTENETIGDLTLGSGASYFSGEASGTTGTAAVITNNLLRFNNATLNARGRSLGLATGNFNQLRIGTAANQTAFIGTGNNANLVGGGGAAGSKTISIVPWAIGESTSGALLDTNMGNSLVTYVTGAGLRPLVFATEYNTFATKASNADNIRLSLTAGADVTGLAGTTVNALVLHNGDTTASTRSVAGSGTGQTLAITSGALLFTRDTAGAGDYFITLGGFNGGITMGGTGITNEYVIHVVNPDSATLTKTLTATISSPLTTVADITKSGRGTLILSGANTAGGGAMKTTINEGTLQIADLDNIGGNTGGLVFAGGTLKVGAGFTDDLSTRAISFLLGGGTIDNTVDLSLAGSLGSGPGGFAKAGANTLTLNGAASYTGGTTVAAGTLALRGNQAIGNGDLTVAAGAVLDLGSTVANVVNVNLPNSATDALIGSGTLTVSGTMTVNRGAVFPVLAGSMNLIKQTAAQTVTLNNAASTFTGYTHIQDGTLAIATIANAGTVSPLGAPTLAGGNSEIRLGLGTATGTLSITGAGGSTDREFSLLGTTGGGILDNDGTGALILNGAIRANEPGAKLLTLAGASTGFSNVLNGTIDDRLGTIAVTKTEAGTWVLNGAKNYTGINTITLGTLQVNTALNGLGNSTATGAITLNGGTLSLRNDGAGNNGSIVYGSTGNPNGYPVSLVASSTINVDNLTANTGNAIVLGPLTQPSALARTLTVTGANGYSLTISNLGLATGTGQTTTLVANAPVTLNAVTNPMTGFGSGNFDTLVLDGTAGGVIAGVIADAVGGSLTAGGTTRLTKQGTGTWTLNSANTFSGLTTISAGVLQLNNGNAIQNSALTVSVNNGLAFGPGIGTFTAASLAGAGNLALTDTASAAVTLVAGGNNTGTTYSGVLSGSGTLVKTGTGKLVLNNGLNTFGSLVIRAGAVQGSQGTTGQTTSLGSGSVTLGDSGGSAPATLEFQGAVPSYANPIILGTTAGALTIQSANNSADVVVSGGITGPNSVLLAAGLSGASGSDMTFTTLPVNNGGTVTNTSLGNGALRLNSGVGSNVTGVIQSSATSPFFITGPSTYGGPTTVNAGTLNISGALNGTNAFNVLSSGSVLNLTGPFAGGNLVTGVSVAGGATLNLVNGAGVPLPSLTSLNLGAGTGVATLNLELGASSDLLTLTGAATTANSVRFNLTGVTGLAAGTYDLISAPGGGLSGAAYSLGNISGPGFRYTLNSTNNVVRLTVAAFTGDIYWRGSLSNSWAPFTGGLTNWTSDLAGTVNAAATPGAGSTVIFSATSATGPAISTTLDANFTVNDLKFTTNPTGVTGVTIAAGTPATSSLTIAPSSSTVGIDVADNAGNIVISAPVVLGAAQTWTVSSTGASLAVSGGVTGTGAVTKAGAGTITFTGANTYSGATTVNTGLVTAGVANTFSPNSAYTVNGSGLLRLNGFSNAIGSLAGNGTVQNNSATTAATLTVGNDNSNTTFSGTIQNGAAAALALTKTGTGTLTITGALNQTGSTIVNRGTLVAAGTSTATGSYTVGNSTTSAMLIVPTGGTLTGSTVVAGSANNSAGAVIVSGGTMTMSAADSDSVSFGSADGGYGALTVTGGNFTQTRFMFGGTSGTAGAGGIGVGLITGGTVRTNGYIILGRRGGSIGSLTITGGTIDHTGASQHLYVGFQDGARGELNVAGGLIDNTGRNVLFGGFSPYTGTGVVNLNAGTLLTNSVGLNQTTGTSYWNFNGGTLKAAAASTSFFAALNQTSVYVNGAFGSFAGGAVIDTNGFNDTIGANLLAPTGDGVSNLALATQGSGYVGAPYVSISGTGAGATAIANMVDDGTGAGTFKIASITITNPGVDYTGTPTFTLSGGGAATAATPGTVSTAPTTSGGLTKNGVGILTLSGANTYTGVTTVNAGTLLLGANNVLADTSGLTVNGGIFDLNTRTETVGAVTLQSGTIAGTTGVLTASSYNVQSGTAAAILGGAASLTKTTAGTVTLSGVNTFSGAVNVNGGTLAFSTNANLGDSSATNTISLAGGTLSYTGATSLNLGATRVLSVGAGTSTIDVPTAAATLTFGGASGSASTGSLVKTGAGTAILSGALNISGAITVSGGLLSGGFGTTGTTISLSAGTTLNFIDSSAVTRTLSNTANVLTLAAGSTLGFELGSGTTDQILGGASSTAAVSGAVNIDLFSLGSLSSGTFTLISMPGGGLLNTNGSTGSYSINSAPGGFLFSLDPSDTLLKLMITSVNIPTMYWRNGLGDNSWSSLSGGNTNWTTDLAGTVNAQATPASATDVIFSAINAPGTALSTTLDGSFTVKTLSFTSNPNGVTSITIAPGTPTISALTITPASAATGIDVADNAGAVNISAGVVLGADQTWTVAGTGANGSSLAVGGNLSGSVNLTKAGAGTLTLAGTNSYGATVISAGTLQIGNGGLTGTLGMGAVTNNGSLIFNHGATANIAVPNAISGPGSLTKIGAGTVTLSGLNTYTGKTIVSGGFLKVSSEENLGSDPGVAAADHLTLSGGGMLQATETFALDDPSRGITVGTGGGGIATDAGKTLTVNNLITGAGSFTKGGPGLLVLALANNYAGGTVIDGGTLKSNVAQTLTGGLTFGTAPTSTLAGTLDMGTAGVSFTGGLLVQNNNATGNTITAGQVSFGGNVIIGATTPTANSLARLTINGGGSLSVNTPAGGLFQVGGATSSSQASTLDLTALTSATINVSATGTVRVNQPTGTNVLGNQSSLLLPTPAAGILPTTPVTTITAANFNVGDNGGNQGGASQTNSVTFGTGLTTLNVNTVNIGTGIRDFGQLTFAPGNGTLRLRAANGTGRTAFNLGTGTANTAVAPGTGVSNNVNFSGHSVDLLISTLAIGAQNRNTTRTDTFTFDTGTLDATTVVVGTNAGTANGTSASTTWTSALNLAGGTSVIGAGGLDIANGTTAVTGTDVIAASVNISGGAVTIANNATFGAAIRLGQNTVATGLTANGALNLTGGSLTVDGHIIRGSTTGAGSATVTLDGGTLDMSGKNIGSATNLVTFNAQKGILSNLGELNGGALLTKTGPDTLVLTGTNNYTGGTTISAGTLQVGDGATSGNLGTGAVINNANLNFSRTDAVAIASTISGTGTITQNGGILTLNGAVTGQALHAASGQVKLGAGDTTPANPNHSLTALTIDSGSTVQFMSGGLKLVQATSLTLAGTAKLDLTGNAFVLDYLGSVEDSLKTAAVRDMLLAGFAGGLWNGIGGINTSKVADEQAASPTTYQFLTGLGYMPGSLTGGTFLGRPVDAGSVVMRYTYYGDANLDGVVNGLDYGLIDTGFANQNTPGFVYSWVNGDFNYDGRIDGADYALMDTAAAFSNGAAIAPAPPESFASADTAPLANVPEAESGPAPEAQIGSLPTAVPEPASFGLLMLGGAVLGLRRRRPSAKHNADRAGAGRTSRVA